MPDMYHNPAVQTRPHSIHTSVLSLLLVAVLSCSGRVSNFLLKHSIQLIGQVGQHGFNIIDHRSLFSAKYMFGFGRSGIAFPTKQIFMLIQVKIVATVLTFSKPLEMRTTAEKRAVMRPCRRLFASPDGAE